MRENTSSSIKFHLMDEDVHIWSITLPSDQTIGQYYSLLSSDEKERSGRFHFEKDHRHYVLGRAILRVLVASYLGMQPFDIQFGYSQLGKPFIPTYPALQFNLSHCKDRAVYIFNLERQVGIDLEHVLTQFDEDRFAAFYFSSKECALINSLDGLEKTSAFFKIWTCKEATLKAIGSGLTKEISQTEVSLNTDNQPHLLCIDGDKQLAAAWHLELFTPFDGYQAALAIESRS